MIPLRVTARMLDGRLATYDGRLPLDGPLAWAMFYEQDQDRVHTNLAATDRIEEADLSRALARVELGGDWFWACSWAQYQAIGEHIEYQHRRFDIADAERYVDFGKRRGRIVTGGGPYKNRRAPIVTMLVDQIVWYCVGDPGEIGRLLAYIRYLGKHGTTGHGYVESWSVEPWPHDWSVYGPDGRLMRAIPDPNGDAMAGIRPPYWAPSVQRTCRIPEAAT